MRQKKILTLMLASISVFIFGCSSIPDLTQEQSDKISNYSATVLLKYDKGYKDSLEVEESTDTSTDTNIDESTTDVSTDETAGETTNESSTDEEVSDNSTDTSTNTTEEPTDNTDSSTSEDTESVVNVTNEKTLSELLAVDGVEFTYKGADIETSVREEGYVFSVNAGKNNSLAVIRFEAVNTTDKQVKIDIASLDPKFYLVLSNGTVTESQLPILPSDLSSFEGNLDANASKELLLIFETKSETMTTLKGLSLVLDLNGTKSKITL